MKIILTKDIAGLGAKNDLIEVKAGYGANYLIPQGMAIIATAANQKMVAENVGQQTQRSQDVKLAAETLAQRVSKAKVVLFAGANQQNKIFGTVTPQHLAQELSKHNISIDHKQIRIPDPVKTLGSHQAVLTLHKAVQVQLSFEVRAN